MTPGSVLTVWLFAVWLGLPDGMSMAFLAGFLYVWYRRLPVEKRRFFR